MKTKDHFGIALQDSHYCVEGSPPSGKTDEHKQKKWEGKDHRAHSLIGLYLFDENLEDRRDVEEAKEM